MALTMKNFNVLSVHWKICFLGEEFKKTNIEGMSLKKGGFGILSTKRFGETLFQQSQEIFKQGYELVNFVSIVIVTYFSLL